MNTFVQINDYFGIGINIKISPHLKLLETNKYNLNSLESQILSIKKTHFTDLFIYETKKQNNPMLIPDKTILSQNKSLERDPTYLSYKKSIEVLKMKIKKNENDIDGIKKQFNTLFTFTTVHLKQYIKMLDDYINSDYQTGLLDLLGQEIFRFEFNDSKLYFNIKFNQQYNILRVLVESAPKDYKHIFNYFMDFIEMDMEYFQRSYFEKNPNHKSRDFINECDLMITKRREDK